MTKEDIIKPENLVAKKPTLMNDNPMHYCPGCSHGVVHKLVAEVIEEMGLEDKAIGISPVGCAVFIYNYIDIDWQEAAHGRAPALATAIKRLWPDRLVFTYQGDGDLACIGTAETIHALNRGENITITGGTVNATGGWGGAGIGGGGGGGNGKNITIIGGTVTAGGGYRGAGIGGGISGSGKNITITGGTVNADGGTNAAGIGGGATGSGSNVTVSGAAQVTAIAFAGDRWDGVGATIGSGSGGSTKNPDGTFTPGSGQEIQANISGLITGWIHHIIYDPALVSEDNPDGILKEWWEPERPQPNPEDPNAPAEESNEVDLGTPLLHVETLEGDLLPFDARQQGGTLRVTTDNLAARLHGTRQALEALQEQGVEQIQFVTTLKTTTLPVAELLAEGGSWFALEHNGLVSRRLSAAQAESLKCQMR